MFKYITAFIISGNFLSLVETFYQKWKLFIKKNRVEKTLYSKKYINLFEFVLFN